MLILVKDVFCPVCGTSEVDDRNIGQPFQFCANRVFIRGFKVGDEHGWWSECMCDHTIAIDEGEPENIGQIWFVVDSEVDGRVHIELNNGRRFIYECGQEK